MADIEIDQNATVDSLITKVLEAGYKIGTLSNSSSTVMEGFWFCSICNYRGAADWGRGHTPGEAIQRAFHGARESVPPDLPEDDGASLLE